MLTGKRRQVQNANSPLCSSPCKVCDGSKYASTAYIVPNAVVAEIKHIRSPEKRKKIWAPDTL